MTCSTTDPQAQEAARGLSGADASTRGRAVGSLLAGEIAEAAITTAATVALRVVRCICFCCGLPCGVPPCGLPLWGRIGRFDKLVSRRQAGSAAGRPVRATISHELGMYAPKTLQLYGNQSLLVCYSR